MGLSTRVAPFLLVMVSVVWGTTFFIVKDTVSQVDPFLLVAIRSTLAALPLFFILTLRKIDALKKWQTVADGAILGSLLATMYTSQTIGLQYTSSGHSAFVTGIAVVLVPVVMFLFFKYRFRVPQLVAIGVSAFGLYLLTYDANTHINIGDLITLITAITAALHIVLVGRMARRNDVTALVVYQFVFCALFNFAGHLLVSPVRFEVPEQAYSALLYLGFVGTLFCYGAASWAQKYVNPVAAGLIFSLEPVFAAIFSFWFVGEILSLNEISGAALILLGIVLYELPITEILKKLVNRQKQMDLHHK